MWLNKIVSASAASAIAGIVPAMSSAQTVDYPIVLSFEGVMGKGNQSEVYSAEVKLGNNSKIEDDTAFVGSVGLSRAINEDWDWNLSVSQLHYAENAVSIVDDSDVSVSMTNNASRSEANFTLGRDVALGSAKGRLGLGLAYAKASAVEGLDFNMDDAISVQSDLQTQFQGIGPRASFDLQSAPITHSGGLSVIGGIEMNLLAGKYEQSKGLDAYVFEDLPVDFADLPDDLVAVAQSENGRLATAGIKFGVQYDANEKTSFRAGVRWDFTRMDRVALDEALALQTVSVDDQRTSFFVGMNVSF